MRSKKISYLLGSIGSMILALLNVFRLRDSQSYITVGIFSAVSISSLLSYIKIRNEENGKTQNVRCIKIAGIIINTIIVVLLIIATYYFIIRLE